ncbi:type II toxin-antitoxin system RelE/ParE family toxin [archaeon]|nr:type II toxin-antitoxin system RelE/ParE family toxin [archaeon]
MESLAFLVRIPKKVDKQFERLPKKRIEEKLREAAENPRHFFKFLKGLGIYELRSGKYRVLVDIDFSLETIDVLKVGHKKEIKKKTSF